MSVDYHEVEEQSSRRKWLRYLIVAVVVVVLLFIAWRVLNARRVNHALAALKSASYPTTLEDLERMYYPAIPPEENAATYYAQAFALFKTSTNKPTGSWWYNTKLARTGELWPSNDMAKVLRTIEENQPYMAALRSNFPSKGSRYPLNFSQGFGMLLPHLTQVSEGVRFLVVEAALNADAGKTEAALDDLDAAFRLGNSLRNEPILISQLTRLRQRAMIVSCVERMLNRQALSDGQLKRLTNSFATSEYPAGLERAIAGELCMVTAFFQMPAQERALLFASPDPSSPSSQPTISSGSVFHGLYSVSGLMDRDFNFYLRGMIQSLWLSRVSFPERLDEGSKIDEKLPERAHLGHYLYSAMFLQSTGNLGMREAEHVARLRLAQTALTLERYRLANGGKVPESLNDLTPGFLAAVPLDPFDGKPLRYEKLEKGYMVYSIGRNRQDDGGVEKSPDRTKVKDDIIFRVER